MDIGLKEKAKKVLIVGCGDLGSRLATPLSRRGFAVSGLRRTKTDMGSNIKVLPADVTDAVSLQIVAKTSWDVVIITLTARGEAAYHAVYITGVSNLLAALKQSAARPLILFASSTSVYAQTDGSVVDENSETLASSYSGRTMLKAEQLVANSGFDFSVVRFSGIYGHGRGGHLLSAMQKNQICPSQPVRYSNRIHVEDCIGIFMHLIDRYFEGKALQGIYLGSDNCPSPLREVMEWLAKVNGLDVGLLKPEFAANRGGNKRCDNRRLVSSEYQFKYPDYKSGYLAADTTE